MPLPRNASYIEHPVPCILILGTECNEKNPPPSLNFESNQSGSAMSRNIIRCCKDFQVHLDHMNRRRTDKSLVEDGEGKIFFLSASTSFEQTYQWLPAQFHNGNGRASYFPLWQYQHYKRATTTMENDEQTLCFRTKCPIRSSCQWSPQLKHFQQLPPSFPQFPKITALEATANDLLGSCQSIDGGYVHDGAQIPHLRAWVP